MNPAGPLCVRLHGCKNMVLAAAAVWYDQTQDMLRAAADMLVIKCGALTRHGTATDYKHAERKRCVGLKAR